MNEPPRDSPPNGDGRESPQADDGHSIVESLGPLAGRAPKVELRKEDSSLDVPVKPASGEQHQRLRGRSSYKLLGEIARGGVGVILKGYDADLRRDVAVKLLRGEYKDDADILRRFVEEAQIGGQLQHPGIVPVYELGMQADQRPFFAMKLIKGKTLSELLGARGNPTEDRRRFLSIFEQICQTAAYAHSRGVIHRDLKPQNVMVGAFGEVQVVDWGLAKVLTREEEEPAAAEAVANVTLIETARADKGSSHTDSVAGSVLGTPGYMPPEQAMGAVNKVDERSDVFALGAILCEILTGSGPYAGKQSPLMAAADADLDDARARLDHSGADPELIALAHKCLAPAREVRPADAGVLARQISAHLAAAEERVREAQARAAGERKSRRLTLALAGVVLISATLGGGSYLWSEGQRRDRVSKTASAVSEALNDANLLIGQARRSEIGDVSLWQEARTAAARAKTALESGEADAAIRQQVEELLVRLEQEAGAAQHAADAYGRDAQMLERLDAIGAPESADFDPANLAEVNAAFAHAFADYGLDLRTMPVDAAAEEIGETPIAFELSFALDAWARTLPRNSPAGVKPSRTDLIVIAQAADPDELRSQVRDAVIAGDLPRLQEFVEELDFAELPAATLDLLASAFLGAGDGEGAAYVYLQAVMLHPGNFSLVFHLGQLSMKGKMWQEAVHAFSIAQALRPENVAVRVYLIQCLFEAGEFDIARRVIDSLMVLAPDHAVSYEVRGTVRKIFGDLPGAIEDLRRASELDPDSVQYQFDLGAALQDAGDIVGAIAAFERAVEMLPDDAGLRARLGWVLEADGDLEGALEQMREAARLDGTNFNYMLGSGNILEKMGDLDAAIGWFLRATQHSFNEMRERIIQRLIFALYANGESGRAMGEIDKLLAAAPDEARPRSLCAALYMVMEEYDVALELLEAVVAEEPAGALQNSVLASLLAMDEDFRDLQRAELLARQAVATASLEGAGPRDSDHINPWNILGQVLYEKGDYEGAMEAFGIGQKRITLHPSELHRFYAAMSLHRLGREQDARERYRGAVEACERDLAGRPPSEGMLVGKAYEKIRGQAAEVLGIEE